MRIPIGGLSIFEEADLVLAFQDGGYKIVKSRTPLRVVVIGVDGTILKEKALGQ